MFLPVIGCLLEAGNPVMIEKKGYSTELKRTSPSGLNYNFSYMPEGDVSFDYI